MGDLDCANSSNAHNLPSRTVDGMQLVRVVGGPEKTRRHVTIMDPTSSSAVTHVQVPGMLHPASLFDIDGPIYESVVEVAKNGAVIALSGSLPKGAPLGFYATLIHAINGAGGKVQARLCLCN